MIADALRLAKEATNGWACYAKRKIELDEIARLHQAIRDLEALAALRTERGAQEPPLMEALQRQLDAVDAAIGFPHDDGLGRIELIERLKVAARAPHPERTER